MRRDRRAGVLIVILVVVLGSVCRAEAVPVTWAASVTLAPLDGTDMRIIHRRLHGLDGATAQPGSLLWFPGLISLPDRFEAWIAEEYAWSTLLDPKLSTSLLVGYLETAMACHGAGITTPEELASCVADWQAANLHSVRGWLVLVAPYEVVPAEDDMPQETPPPVPEPSTVVLVGTSLLFLGLKALKRR